MCLRLTGLSGSRALLLPVDAPVGGTQIAQLWGDTKVSGPDRSGEALEDGFEWPGLDVAQEALRRRATVERTLADVVDQPSPNILSRKVQTKVRPVAMRRTASPGRPAR